MLLYVVLRQLINLQSLGLIATRTTSDVGALLRLAYFDAFGRPVAHSFLGLHPRPARLTPSGTVEQAYALNLTAAQYEAVYEINLDYLMSLNGHADVFGIWWDRPTTFREKMYPRLNGF